ncbi:MAG TPA: DNA polymerase, partial [Rhodanobacteraceae bacterium]|nr:DNA polymerase [Rhodanobacteraceae bacterium]
MSRPTLTLIDGSGYLYRAFHALPPLTNRTGEPTGALFGVFNMVRLALKSKPDYVAFVSDAAGPTFRDELFAEYKAHRPAMPDDLRVQIEPMLALVGALGFPILRVDGVEADDVIGTLALQAAASGIDVVVSTGDKDLAQLVGPHITLVNTMTNSTLDVAGVKAKFGVAPEQIIDYLALVGDSSDNIPGVEKCGPKTAAKWLAEYGTLDGVIANADKIGGKIGENLRAALPHLPLSRQLATVKTDVALDVTPAGLTLRAPDTEKLREFYRRYEFNAALKELEAAAVASPAFSLSSPASQAADGDAQPSALSPQPLLQSTPSPPNPPHEVEGLQAKGEYELVLTLAQFEDWLAKLRNADLIAFDTETNSLDPMRAEIIGVSFAVEPERAAYVPLAHEYAGVPAQLDRNAVLAALRPLLEDADKDKVGQHLKYDMNVLSAYAIEVRGVRYDSMLESYVLNSSTNRHDMDALAKRYLGIDTIRYEDVTGKGARQIPFAQVDVQRAADYAAEDADITLRLHRALWPRLEAEPKLRNVFEQIEMPLVPVLARMEQTGVLVDAGKLKAQSQDLGRRMLDLQQRAYAVAGRHFSLDSPKQLQMLLYDELKLPATLKTPTGQPSTNEEALEA